jgi:nucleotide-binding universal stress UspA family protein
MTDTSHRPVVVGVDGSDDSLQAVDVAAGEAALHGLPLHIVHAYVWPLRFRSLFDTPYPSSDIKPRDGDRDIARQAVDRAREWDSKLDISTHLIAGYPAGELVAASEHAAMTMVGCRGRGGFSELLAGSVSTQVATHGHGTVIVVRGKGAIAAGTVVVGVDVTQPNAEALRFAFKEASLRHVALHAVYAWASANPERHGPWASNPNDYENLQEAADRHLSVVLAGWREKFPEVIVTASAIRGSNTTQVLLDTSVTAGLLVVGSRGFGEVHSALVSAVGYTLIHHADCPVAVVHPNSKA